MSKKKLLWACLLLSCSAFAPNAECQKLPSRQVASLAAPGGVQIDGVFSEWGVQYQAYNNNIEAFYTIANDSDNLYLIIHASKSRIIEKMIEGGISLTVNESGRKNDKSNKVVLFPLMPLPICKGVLVAAGKRLTGKTLDHTSDYTEMLDSMAKAKHDNGIVKANVILKENLKEIKLSGIADVIDTVPNVDDKTPYYRTLPLRAHKFKIIALKNRDKISAMVQFDDKGELTYELAIPLKLLSVTSKPNKFYYNITINGRGEDGRPGNTWSYAPPPAQGMLDQDLEEPTDFWGEYVLKQ